MRRTPVLVLLVLTLALPIPALAQSATPAASPSAASGDFAGLVDIGGRKLYLECHGDGQSDRDPGGGLPRVWPLLDGRLAPPGCAADDGVARGGRVHPRLYLRPPRDRRQHRRGAPRQPQRRHRPAPDHPGGGGRAARAAAGGRDPRPLRPGGPLAGAASSRGSTRPPTPTRWSAWSSSTPTPSGWRP